MPPPLAIAGYELLHPLGGGQLTQVFAARRAGDGPCAIKLPRSQWSADSDANQLLQREAEALNAVRHPHVVRLIDSRFQSEPGFLVLELLDGESLRERLQRDVRLDQRIALWIARQIAEGLQAVHHAGFIHGDVKPDNVQIDSTGRAVLLDLGFAHRPNQCESLESEGYLLGTLNYLAPEPAGIDDFTADWFSFGVLLHEMLTGELPHPPRTMEQVLNRSMPDSRDVEIANVPSRLVELLAGLLSPSPKDRPHGSFVIHELIALEIAALSHRKAG